MQKSTAEGIKKLFGLLTLVNLALSVFVFLLFLAGLVTGSASLAVAGGTWMEWGIRLAALATLSGLVYIYVTGEHSLSMDAGSPSSEKDREG